MAKQHGKPTLAQKQAVANETTTVTVTAETGNGIALTSQETLVQATVAEPTPTPTPDTTQEPVPAPDPVPAPQPASAPEPVPESVTVPVSVPVTEPTSPVTSQQQQVTNQKAVYQPSGNFKKTYGFW